MVALSDNFLKHLETVSQVAANLRKVGSNSAGPGTNKEKVFVFSKSTVQFDRRKFRLKRAESACRPEISAPMIPHSSNASLTNVSTSVFCPKLKV